MPVIEAADREEGAIVRALNSEMEGMTTDLKKDINYQLINDGTAVRCLVNGDPGTGTTLTVDTPGSMYLRDGMLISILNPSSGVARTSSTGLTITSVDSDTVATMSAALDSTVADNDWVIAYGGRAGAAATLSDSYEMMGLKGIIDDATYCTTLHNLSRSSYAWWKCSTFADDDNSGSNRDLTIPLMQSMSTAVEKNGGNTQAYLASLEVRDAYAAELVSDKRYVNTMKLDGGWTGIEYNGKPVIADSDMLPNTLFAVDFDHLFLMEMADFDWMDKDGAVLSRVSGYDAYEAVLRLYAEFTTDRPRSFGFLRDVQ